MYYSEKNLKYIFNLLTTKVNTHDSILMMIFFELHSYMFYFLYNSRYTIKFSLILVTSTYSCAISLIYYNNILSKITSYYNIGITDVIFAYEFYTRFFWGGEGHFFQTHELTTVYFFIFIVTSI